ncbi:MAG TPA: TetR family transcriptional regulator [Candidatus Dormibacteraeota bacterium]|jgi:AcrR family transcriptional regulator|nr:TetR family transcriptional regulator [Candidatus Dormibacteraeota bacterium]
MAAVRLKAGERAENGARLTAIQERRRRAIIDAAMALAAEGGYEAVQMREVAARANVALGTLYRYFPSKEQLLVAGMAEQVTELRQRLRERPPAGDTPAQRVIDDLRRANRALQRQPDVTSAMLKSLIAGGDGEELAQMMEPISENMTAIIVSAMGHAEPDEHDKAVAEVIQHVWMAALLWWVAGHAPATHLDDTVARAVKLLLGD